MRNGSPHSAASAAPIQTMGVGAPPDPNHPSCRAERVMSNVRIRESKIRLGSAMSRAGSRSKNINLPNAIGSPRANPSIATNPRSKRRTSMTNRQIDPSSRRILKKCPTHRIPAPMIPLYLVVTAKPSSKPPSKYSRGLLPSAIPFAIAIRRIVCNT